MDSDLEHLNYIVANFATEQEAWQWLLRHGHGFVTGKEVLDQWKKIKAGKKK